MRPRSRPRPRSRSRSRSRLGIQIPDLNFIHSLPGIIFLEVILILILQLLDLDLGLDLKTLTSTLTLSWQQPGSMGYWPGVTPVNDRELFLMVSIIRIILGSSNFARCQELGGTGKSGKMPRPSRGWFLLITRR